MKFSGISRAQLLEELKAYQAQLQGDVEFFSINVGWYGRAKLDAVKAELSDVQAFLASLVGSGANVAQTGSKAPRCPHYHVIRRAFAIARDKGLNVKDESAMRSAIAAQLGMPVPSRDVLGAWHWKIIGDLIKADMLAW